MIKRIEIKLDHRLLKRSGTDHNHTETRKKEAILMDIR